MAININQRYPNQTAAPSTAYPFGSAKNNIQPQDGTGTPLEKDWVNDLQGFFQASLAQAGLSPSGQPENANASQVLDALKILLGGVPDLVKWTNAGPFSLTENVFQNIPFTQTVRDDTGVATPGTIFTVPSGYRFATVGGYIGINNVTSANAALGLYVAVNNTYIHADGWANGFERAEVSVTPLASVSGPFIPVASGTQLSLQAFATGVTGPVNAGDAKIQIALYK